MPRKLGLVLGSGAARGWAHVGVLRGLDEIGVKPDVVAGCSVGALVGGAYLVGALEEFEAWGRELSPLSAFGAFNFWVNRGGLIDTRPAFEAFAGFDRNIEDLEVKFGAVAADLGTGEEVWITQGSVIAAARASSAIPVLFHAVQRGPRWLVDGAVANPAPVSLARFLGADIVISVDLNANPRVLARFNPPPPSVPALDPAPAVPPVADTFTGAVAGLIEQTRSRIDRQIGLDLRHESGLIAAIIGDVEFARANRGDIVRRHHCIKGDAVDMDECAPGADIEHRFPARQQRLDLPEP